MQTFFFIVARAKCRVGSSTAVGSAIKGAFTFNLIKNLNIQITKRKSFRNYAYVHRCMKQTDRQTDQLYLYDSLGSADFQHLSTALAAISQCQVDNLRKLGELQ